MKIFEELTEVERELVPLGLTKLSTISFIFIIILISGIIVPPKIPIGLELLGSLFLLCLCFLTGTMTGGMSNAFSRVVFPGVAKDRIYFMSVLIGFDSGFILFFVLRTLVTSGLLIFGNPI